MGTRLPERKLFALIGLALALGTFALYSPLLHYPFILFDDEVYITGNSHVLSGLTAANLAWAFTSNEAANWHPLTWISHMIDCQLFGLDAGRHHLVNLLFHIADTLLLFFWLRQLTGALWRSAFVAAAFAWHPLHIESVAWASERKDVLSTLFWLLALIAYTKHVSRVEGRVPGNGITPPATRHVSPYYLLSLLCFACGLMSKPMVVTLPCVLLLLDFWPLGRVQSPKSKVQSLLVEKIPFFALAAAGSVVTFLVQKQGGAIWSASIDTRIENALLAYVRYISKLVWPQDMAIVYSYPRHWPVIAAAGAGVLLLAWTALFIVRARRNPAWLFGWLWFLGTLVPTIGVIQVGSQSIADRYTYIPGIGIFILVAWGAAELMDRWPDRKKFLPIAAALVLTGWIGVTSIQLGYWRDSIALFYHAVAVTTDNYTAENCLGKAYEKAGDNVRALVCYQEAVKAEPRYPQAQFNLATCLFDFGRDQEGLEHLRTAARLVPQDARIQYDLGTYFLLHNDRDDAEKGFRAALALRPDFPAAKEQLDKLLAAAPGPVTNAPAPAPH